ncbi:hypothetical protein GC098_37585 [Paenibacillus sp. LMG 31458]|uniref:Exonuclease domain-containing protein n=1 Tax=Paenibacillus phytorum TaxID=2654977 RepID=A0ABX1YAA4_9BACL|nr:3'-5' exonuclease [Paenibacillus phytorum]NOU77011.1 hypothetical protein [Paenibacillus phytorum]
MNITFLSKDAYLVKDVFVNNLYDRTFCIFDLEGTGINVETEYITQFGGIIFQNGEIIREFSSLVKSPKLIPNAIEELTGITNESLINAPTFPEVYELFLDFCREAVLVTQAGYEYDIPMIEKHCRMYNLPLFDNPVIDTKALYANAHDELFDVFSTDYLINYYQIDDTDVPRHNALGDCILISRILQKILNEYANRNIWDYDLTAGLIVKRFLIPKMYLQDDN